MEELHREITYGVLGNVDLVIVVCVPPRRHQTRSRSLRFHGLFYLIALMVLVGSHGSVRRTSANEEYDYVTKMYSETVIAGSCKKR